jgi:transcriptional regulator with XRE-family HTH domain
MKWNSVTVRNMRQRLNLSQADFAKLLGVDVRSVSRWETGNSIPTGAAEEILTGLKEKLDGDPDSAQQIIGAIAAAIAIGGLAYLVIKLLDAFTTKGGD